MVRREVRRHVPDALGERGDLRLRAARVVRVAREALPRVTQGGPVRLVRAELRGVQVPANQVGLDVAGGRGRGAVSSGA